jgi:membrane protein DedA with SNARE-associated domain
MILAYVLVGLLTAIEGGEISLFVAGYLIGTGELLLWPTIVLVACSLFVGDFLWYYHGPRLFRLPLLNKCGSFFTRVDKQIQSRPRTVAFLARFSYGLHHAIIARYRENGIGPKKMAPILASTGIVWLAILGGIVVFLAEYTPEIKQYMRFAEFAFAGGFIVLIIVEFIVTRAVRKRL